MDGCGLWVVSGQSPKTPNVSRNIASGQWPTRLDNSLNWIMPICVFKHGNCEGLLWYTIMDVKIMFGRCPSGMPTRNRCLENAIPQQPPKLHPLERWRLDDLFWKQFHVAFQSFDAIVLFPYPKGSEPACFQERKAFAYQHQPKLDTNAIYHRRCPRTPVPYVFWQN